MLVRAGALAVLRSASSSGMCLARFTQRAMVSSCSGRRPHNSTFTGFALPSTRRHAGRHHSHYVKPMQSTWWVRADSGDLDLLAIMYLDTFPHTP